MKKQFSKFTYFYWILLFTACYWYGSAFVNYRHAGHYIWSDAEGYYMYLPAVSVFGTFENFPVRTAAQHKKYPGTDKVFTKYTYGVALMELPFFGAAYLSRMVQGFDPKVYPGNDYSVALLVAGCFYGVLGLYFLFNALKRSFKARLPGILIIGILLLGTNLLHYMSMAPGMAHAYLFFLASLFVFLTPRLFEKPSYGNYLLSGLLLGLIILIRPTDGIVAVYPLLYGIKNTGDLKARVDFLRHHFAKIALAALPLLLVWLPQFYYWHYITGHWVYYSYEKEGFDFLANPQILKVLFSPLNGWLLYNPVMLIPLFGIFPLLKGNRLNSVAIFAIIGISTYIFGSWWCWWFGGAYGHRSYIELLPFLAFPLGYVVSYIFSKPTGGVKWVLIVLIVLFCYYNMRLNFLYKSEWSERYWSWQHYFTILKKVFFIS